MEKSPILIVDDDEDERELIESAVAALKVDRPVHYFQDGKGLMDFLKAAEVPPFLILCDLHLPGQDGFEIRKEIGEQQETKYKSVPFIYWSTAASEKQIQHAYDLPAQGFFFKPTDYQ